MMPDLLRSVFSSAVVSSNDLSASGPPARRTGPLDLSDPRDNVEAFGRMWGSFGEPVLACFHGTMYGVVGTERARPLFGYQGTGITRCRMLPNGHVMMRGKETGFFTDLETGRPIDSWYNPYTDETVEVFHFLNDRIGAELTTEMPRLVLGDDEGDGTLMNDVDDGMGTIPFVLPWQTFGDDVLLEWSYSHSYANPVDPTRWPRASTGPVINPAEHFTIFVPTQELTDRDAPSARFRAGFSRTSPWWPWMRMGGPGVEGTLFGSMFSRKTARGAEDLPRPLLEHITATCPAYLEAATDWDVGPILSTWEAFARDVPPEV